METNKQFYEVRKKYLAEALSFLGFKYYKFGQDNDIVYSFIDDEKFKYALTSLINLKNQLRNK